VHEAEHEALMGLLARAAGARVPKVLLVTSFANGAGLLVQERIDGRTLAGLGSDRINDDLLTDLRRQVAALHRDGLAHQDLNGDNIMIDRDGMTWLVDFDQAVAGADCGRIAATTRRWTPHSPTWPGLPQSTPVGPRLAPTPGRRRRASHDRRRWLR
jgi:predicted Ser/Thr protein kinase